MATTEQNIENGAAPTEVAEPKAMAKAGDEALPSNIHSLGYGMQKIKLEYWDPENEEFWKVSLKYNCFFDLMMFTIAYLNCD